MSETVDPPLAPMDIGVLKDEDERPCLEAPNHSARAAETALGRTWLLDGRGRLWSFDAAFQREQSHLSERTIDAIRRAKDGSLWAVIHEANRRRVVRRSLAGWEHLGDVPPSIPDAHGIPNDDAFTELRGRPVVAGRGETWWLDAAGRIHRWPLASSLADDGGPRSAVEASDGLLYVGHDAGEFGGSLDLLRPGAPGRPTTQETILGGPVTDLAVDPIDRQCVIVSQGIIHGSQDGRILRACHGNISFVFNVEEQSSTGARYETKGETLPFFKVIPIGRTVYGVGEKDIYAITGETGRRLPAPTFTVRCGLLIARLEQLTLIRENEVRRSRDFAAPVMLALPALQ